MRKSFYAVMLVALAVLFAGSAFAQANVPIRVVANPEMAPGWIHQGENFTLDFYMTQNSGSVCYGFSSTYKLYSPDGLVVNIVHHDIGGIVEQIPDGSILMLNGFEIAAQYGDSVFWSSNTLRLDSWDGVLPDTFNHTTIALPLMPPLPGWPSEEDVEKLHMQVGLNIPDSGSFCIDSISHADPSYNWLWQTGIIPSFSGPYCWTVSDAVGGILDENGPVLPADFALAQNYPNPFNPSTIIEFALPTKSHVTVSVFNVLGQKIRTLVDEEKTVGYYSEVWDGTDDNGQPAASGIYFYRIDAGNDYTETKKMMLLK